MKKPIVTSIELSNVPFDKTYPNQKIVTYSVEFDQFTITAAADCPSGTCDNLDILSHVQGNINRYATPTGGAETYNYIATLRTEINTLKQEIQIVRSNNTDLIMMKEKAEQDLIIWNTVRHRWWYRLFYSVCK